MVRDRISVSVGRCERCREEAELITHHLIPRWMGGLKIDETTEVCRSCHSSLESSFDNFIKYGKFTSNKWQNMEKQRREQRSYRRRNMNNKSLFHLAPVPNFRYEDTLEYNRRTDKLCVTHAWHTKLPEVMIP